MLLSDWMEAEAICPYSQEPVLSEDHCNQYHPLAEYLELLRREAPATDTSKASPNLDASISQSKNIRSLVSQNKIRFQKDGFDLDLTYITPNIVAMGFPSSGTEAYYRNPMEEVERFMEHYHGAGHYRVYNLCSERQYDNASRFRGNWVRFPFDDHNAPCPMSLIPDLCRDADRFLREDEKNVVAIHCKAGKGRTGVMVSCLLMHQLPVELGTADAALQHFNAIRTKDSQGVTIPSQQRYIRYWEKILHTLGGKPPEPREIVLLKIIMFSPIKASGACDPYVTFFQDNVGSDKKYGFKKSGQDDSYYRDFSHDPIVLVGDIKLVWFHRNTVLSDEHLFHCWLNTAMSDMDLIFDKSSLDKACKDTKHQVIHKDIKVSIHLGVREVVVPTGGGAKGGKPAVVSSSGSWGTLFGRSVNKSS